MFAFARELVNGRVRGFEDYQIRGSISFDHDLQPTDFPVTDPLFKAFKEFVAGDQIFKTLLPAVDHNRSFIEVQLRFNIITAGYGRVTADRVFITTDDPQLARALSVLPRARELAMAARQRGIQP
jgi:carboxyl-terminal processing protease